MPVIIRHGNTLGRFFHHGASKLMSRKCNFRFFLWLFASAACGYQISLRVCEFIDYPVILDLEMRYSKSIIFPSITLCSGVLVNSLKIQLDVWHDLKECKENGTSCPERREDVLGEFYGQLTVPVDYIWSTTSIQPEDLLFGRPCPTFPNDRVDCEMKKITDAAEIQYLNTFWGRCLVLTFNYSVDYQGSFTWFSINWNWSRPDFYPKHYSLPDIYFFPHQNGLLQTHDTPFKATLGPTGYETTVRVTSREFQVVNSWKNPCISAEEAVKCQNSCVDKILENNLSCGLPFINSSKLGQCETYNDIFTTIQATEKMYNELGSGDCTCPRMCKEIEYQTDIDDVKRIQDGLTSIKLIYPQSVTEVLVEKPVHSLSSLFSEIGGSVGIYLGLSVIKVVNVIKLLLSKLVR